MEFPAKHAIVLLILCGLVSYPSAAQRDIQKHPTGEDVSVDKGQVASQTLTPDEGLAVIAAALDSSVHLRDKRDCSHFVHAIYNRAGFPYSYVDSSDLYVGTPNFERVAHPQPGDLVVWPGHVGIVINPSEKVFFSAMHSGPGIDAFDAPSLEAARASPLLPLRQTWTCAECQKRSRSSPTNTSEQVAARQDTGALVAQRIATLCRNRKLADIRSNRSVQALP